MHGGTHGVPSHRSRTAAARVPSSPGRLSGAALCLLALVAVAGCGTTGDTPDGKPSAPAHPTRTTSPPAAPAPPVPSATEPLPRRVADLFFVPSAEGSPLFSNGYRVDFANDLNALPAYRDATVAYDLTSLKGKMVIGPGLRRGCVNKDHVVTCPLPASEGPNDPAFWLKTLPGVPRGRAGEVVFRVTAPHAPPVSGRTTVMVGSPRFAAEPKPPPRRGVARGAEVSVTPRFTYQGDVPLPGGVTVGLESSGSSFSATYANCRYDSLEHPTQAECTFPGPLSPGDSRTLRLPVAATVESVSRLEPREPVLAGGVSYGIRPAGVLDPEFGLPENAPRGTGPALRLVPDGFEPPPKALTYGGIEFTTELNEAAADWAAPAITIKGRVGEEIELEMPPAVEHRLDASSTQQVKLKVVLPPGVSATRVGSTWLSSDAAYCTREGVEAGAILCAPGTAFEPARLGVRIDRASAAGSGGSVEIVDLPPPANGRPDPDPANNSAPLRVRVVR
ncbi:hypothetical protein ACIO3O_27990 [Streptomyces sp. NPDC087440]|uniref:hypothetical protein n=1 Tax=Streptomyces sp. NPDC087440 TaxID=3365790 RepID=UPI00381BAEB4